MAAFEYRQAQEIRDCFQRHRIRYLFLGKSGAILLSFPDASSAEIFEEPSLPVFLLDRDVPYRDSLDGQEPRLLAVRFREGGRLAFRLLSLDRSA